MRSTCHVTCCPPRTRTRPRRQRRRQHRSRPIRRNRGGASMFRTVLHANDGSAPAMKALALAVEMARQNAAALHLVCVEEIPPMPEYIEEIREAKGTAARRFHTVVERARHLAR